MAALLWRVFPWVPDARPGEPYSPQYLPPQSGQGRFDLPHEAGVSAWYFAESPEHAVAEKVQDLRNRTLIDDFLFERGRRLALCSAHAPDVALVADLCDPAIPAGRSIPPDRLAYTERAVTQSIAHHLYQAADAELTGFRWWSALRGGWHTTVLFSDRVADEPLSFANPEALQLSTPAVAKAAEALGIEVDAGPRGR